MDKRLNKLLSSKNKVELIQINPNAEKLIAFMARVSSSNQNNPKFEKLIKYLIDQKHWSPFQMINLTVQITTSRAIAQQILRHRSFNFQEFSQRYAKVQEFETYPARRQDLKNRQNSIDDLDEKTKRWFNISQKQLQTESIERYKTALEKGIAKEQARFLLPLSTQTKLYMNGTVRDWIHYLNLRTGNGTQKEHQLIAKEIQKIFIKKLPVISKALKWS